jgi:hypothetical protein
MMSDTNNANGNEMRTYEVTLWVTSGPRDEMNCMTGWGLDRNRQSMAKLMVRDESTLARVWVREDQVRRTKK